MLLTSCIQNLAPSPTLELTAKTKKLIEDGKDIINLAGGEPDFNSPEEASEAAIKAIQRGFTKYTAVDGNSDLKKAILHKTNVHLKTHFQDNEVIVGAGAKQLIFNALFATLNPEDEVIIPAPYWSSYPSIVKMLGAHPVMPIGEATSHFKITAAQLHKAITPRTKWFILNSPNNPTGAVYTKEELKALAAVLKDYPHVWILSDDIYKEINYAPVPHLSEHTFLRNRLLIIDGVSKVFSMTGWRIGWALGPDTLIQALKRIQSQQTSNACSISQKAALGALEKAHKWPEKIRNIFQERRDMFCKGLQELGFEINIPHGAFYVYAGLHRFMGKKWGETCIDSDMTFAQLLVNHAGISGIPGGAFGLKPYIRFSYTQSIPKLKEALVRLQKACHSLA